MLDKPNLFTIPPIPKEEKKKWTRSPALKAAQQKYYDKNKTKLVEDQLKYNYTYVRQPYTCECGDTMKYSAKYLHMRSDRHARRMENIKNGVPAGMRPCNSQYVCECGSKILHKNRIQHFKSNKHQSYMKVAPTECIIIQENTPQIRVI